jgi:hypothetical protein
MSDPVNNPYGLTFPYPINGTVKRVRGEGCTSCVHKQYCPAIYWHRMTSGHFYEFDAGQGTKCSAWSNNVADIVTTVTKNDTDEVDYIFMQYGGVEPDRCDMPETTGNSRM